MSDGEKRTPWQKVFERLGLSRAELARRLACNRSKFSRVLRDPEAGISSSDMTKLRKIAEDIGVEITIDDVTFDTDSTERKDV